LFRKHGRRQEGDRNTYDGSMETPLLLSWHGRLRFCAEVVKPVSPAKPVMQALLLADHVYQDRATGKHVISGTFRTLNVVRRSEDTKSTEEDTQSPDSCGLVAKRPQEVMQAGSPFVYFNLTDVHGEVHLVLRYVDLTTNEVLFQANVTVQSEDPLIPAEVFSPLPVLPVPREGPYALELLWDDEPLGYYRIVAEDRTG